MQIGQGKDYLEYAKARNQAKAACCQAVQDSEKSVSGDARQNPKAFYSSARSKMKTRKGIADLIC